MVAHLAIVVIVLEYLW